MPSRSPGPLLTSEFTGSLQVIPTVFQAALGVTQTVQEQAVELGPDPISGNLIESTVEQTRTDERKKTDSTLDGTIPITLDAGVQLPDGLVGTSDRTLTETGGTAPSPDFYARESTESNLGNGLFDVTKVEVSSYPEQQGQKYLPELSAIFPFVVNTEPTGTGIGSAVTDIEPIDYLRNKVTTFNLSDYQTAIKGVTRLFPSYGSIDVPEVLLDIGFTIFSDEQSGTASASGAQTDSGTSNWQLGFDHNNSNEAGTGVAVINTNVIKTPYGSNRPVVDIYFYLEDPVLPTNIVTTDPVLLELKAILDTKDPGEVVFPNHTVQPRPNYCPQEIEFPLPETKVYAKAEAKISVSAGEWANDTSSGSSDSYASGTSQSQDVSYSGRNVVIPNTLHTTLSFTIDEDITSMAEASVSVSGFEGSSPSVTTTSTGHIVTAAVFPATTTGVVLSSGTLVIGTQYVITNFVASDDFTNVGGMNATGNIFTATGTTPTNWAHGSTLGYPLTDWFPVVGALYLMELESKTYDYEMILFRARLYDSRIPLGA